MLQKIFKKNFLEFFIALRYLRSQELIPIFNLSTRITFIFMALMVFVMVVVLCVFIGFQDKMKQTLQASGYHLTISKNNSHPFSINNKILDIDKDIEIIQKSIKSKFQSIAVNVLIENYGQYDGKALRALPIIKQNELTDGKNNFSKKPSSNIENNIKNNFSKKLSSNIENKIKNKTEFNIEKSFKLFPKLVYYDKQKLEKFENGNFALIGREMARIYGLRLGDKINILLPQGAFINKNVNLGNYSFTIAGFYRTGFYEYDSNLIFIALKTAERILQIPNQITEIVYQLNDLSTLDQIESLISEKISLTDYSFTTHTIKEEKGNFLAAIQLEKTLMLVILSLLILAGVAGIWVTVRLLVKSKVPSLGLFRAMGMSSNSILLIFTTYAFTIGFFSSAIGASLGIYVSNHLETLIFFTEDAINQTCNLINNNCINVQLIPPYIYFFDHLPVKADLEIILGISLSTLILSGLAGYFPARGACNVNPAQILKNE